MPRYYSPEHAIEYFRTWFGPTKVAFESLDEEGQSALAADMLGVFDKWNRAGDGTLVIEADYAEVVAVRT